MTHPPQFLPRTTCVSTESSVYELHPIRDAASAPARAVPFLLSLGLTPLLIGGLALSLVPPQARVAARAAFDQARRSVSLLLLESPPQNLQSPARNLVGPNLPGGAGHREGTNSIDPRLLPYTTLVSTPSDAIDPDALSTLPTAERVNLSLNPALPIQKGGNGLARGTGRDSALGPGGLSQATARASMPLAPPPDFKLVPIRTFTFSYYLSPNEEQASIKVLLLIGMNGMPTQVKYVSGPVFLKMDAIRTAQGWLFEPLAPHGFKTPQSYLLEFYPSSKTRH